MLKLFILGGRIVKLKYACAKTLRGWVNFREGMVPYTTICDVFLLVGPPTVINMPKNESATKGDTVTLTCTSRGYPPPFVSWRRNLEPIRANPRYHLVSSGGVGTLTIDNVQSGDAGDYRCELQSRLYGTTLSEEIATVTVFDGEKLSIVV